MTFNKGLVAVVAVGSSILLGSVLPAVVAIPLIVVWAFFLIVWATA